MRAVAARAQQPFDDVFRTNMLERPGLLPQGCFESVFPGPQQPFASSRLNFDVQQTGCADEFESMSLAWGVMCARSNTVSST